jgi:hypothetical protein
MLETRIYGDAHHEDRQRPSDGKGLRSRLRHGAGSACRAPLWDVPSGKPRAIRSMSLDERRAHRAEQKRKRRNTRTPIIQCTTCGACATGSARNGQVTSVENLPSYRENGERRHKVCGGVISAYDITGSGDDSAS